MYDKIQLSNKIQSLI